MTSKKPQTLLDSVQGKLRNHPYIVALILSATILSGAVAIIENSQKLIILFSKESQIEPEIVVLLNNRALIVAGNLDRIRREIHEEFERYERENCEASPEIGVDQQCLEISEQSFIVAERFGEIKEQFIELHESHVEALQEGNLIVAREVDAQIRDLLERDFIEAAARNVGIDPGTYAGGFRTVVVDVRQISGFHTTNLYEEYQPVD